MYPYVAHTILSIFLTHPDRLDPTSFSQQPNTNRRLKGKKPHSEGYISHGPCSFSAAPYVSFEKSQSHCKTLEFGKSRYPQTQTYLTSLKASLMRAPLYHSTLLCTKSAAIASRKNYGPYTGKYYLAGTHPFFRDFGPFWPNGQILQLPQGIFLTGMKTNLNPCCSEKRYEKGKIVIKNQ